MGQDLFYSAFSFAKQDIGTFCNRVDSVRQSDVDHRKQMLWSEIVQLIENLKTSQSFFKGIGKKSEVDVLIIFYTSLLFRLDSS